VAGKTMVDGGQLVALLAQRGYQSLYLIAGPTMLATMICNHQLQRLYLTTNHQLLGGEHFHSLIPGAILKETGLKQAGLKNSGLLQTGDLKLLEHYYDAQSSNGHGQFYSCYQVACSQP
jgi:riboflavin biosynthesis pyrimidine reductase